jgi:hypothetical protein
MNDLRLHKALVHNHLCLHHTIRGRSGPILISRGRVVTQPFARDDRVLHFGHLPTHSSAVPTTTRRTPSSPTVTVSTTIPSRPSKRYYRWTSSRIPAIWMRENTQCTRPRAPTTRSESVTRDPHQLG